MNEDVQVISPVDIAKGIEAGDHNLEVGAVGIQLKPTALVGTAVFTVGQREIETIYRIVPILSAPLAPTDRLTLTVAGSIDGISFNAESPAQPVMATGETLQASPIELGFLIPEGSRFVRATFRFERANLSTNPSLIGFVTNIGRPVAVSGASDATAVLINGAPMNSEAGTVAPAGQPTSLVVTGLPLAPIGIVTVLLSSFWLRRLTVRRRLEGAARGRNTPDTP